MAPKSTPKACQRNDGILLLYFQREAIVSPECDRVLHIGPSLNCELHPLGRTLETFCSENQLPRVNGSWLKSTELSRMCGRMACTLLGAVERGALALRSWYKLKCGPVPQPNIDQV